MTPGEVREGTSFWRKYVINKTLPPKELNVPRKEPSEALLISMMKKFPDTMRMFR